MKYLRPTQLLLGTVIYYVRFELPITGDIDDIDVKIESIDQFHFFLELHGFLSHMKTIYQIDIMDSNTGEAVDEIRVTEEGFSYITDTLKLQPDLSDPDGEY